MGDAIVFLGRMIILQAGMHGAAVHDGSQSVSARDIEHMSIWGA